jgi:hypothetical protein
VVRAVVTSMYKDCADKTRRVVSVYKVINIGYTLFMFLQVVARWRTN